jgi:hypothetical protein
MIPLQKNSKFRQGIFNPKNQQKYVGREKPVYRSGWELKFFRWCDDNPNVVEWASEAVIIPYLNPVTNKVQRYYTDGVIALQEVNGVIKKYVVEIKPSSQVTPPKPGKKKHATVMYEAARFVQNQAKWEAARKWCAKKGYSFWILTEKELGLYKYQRR